MSTAWLDAIETPRLWLRCPQPGDGDALYSAVQESLAALRQWPDSCLGHKSHKHPKEQKTTAKLALVLLSWACLGRC